MATNQKIEVIDRVKVIYNPFAGTTKKLVSNPISLEDVKHFLERYEIDADFYPTEHKGHATELAHNAIKEKYKLVLVAGGDGTVGEAANGLVNSDVTLGILPMGTYMNIARMLSIPLDIEKAVMILRIGQIRKIDVGAITTLSGKKLDKPYVFLESVGFGLEAQVHQYAGEFEKGNIKAPFILLKTVYEYLSQKAEVIMDNQTIRTKATNINISNGPYSGPALPMAPKAKLNDHHLTITVFKMGKFDLFYYFLRLWLGFKRNKKPQTYESENVQINTKHPRLVHADARLYGETPVEVKIIPQALKVLTGFPDQSDPIKSFKKATILEP